MISLRSVNASFMCVMFTLSTPVSIQWTTAEISGKNRCGLYLFDPHWRLSRPATTLPPPTPPPLTQALMIGSYIDYITYKGSVCDIRFPRNNTYRYANACSCPTLSYNLAKLVTYPAAIKSACRTSPVRRQDGQLIASFHIMCGYLAFYGEEKTFTSLYQPWNVKVPSRLMLNVTIWHFRSVSIANFFPNCMHVWSIYLIDHYGPRWKPERRLLHLCGTVLPRTIFTLGERVSIRHGGKGSHDPTSLLEFFLAYQPVEKSHVKRQLFDPSRSSQEGHLLALEHDEHTQMTSLNIDNVQAMFQIGDYDHQMWWSVRSILNFPEITELNLSCPAINHLRKSYVSIYDAPLHPLHVDPGGHWKSYHLDTLYCGVVSRDISYKSTLGDLTIYLAKRRDDVIAFSADVSHRNCTYAGRYCEMSTLSISQESEAEFALSSGNKTIQKRILISIDSRVSGFISLSDIAVQFEGFTDFPCIYGGVFLFEGESMSLVTSLCTSWVSQLWDGAISYEHGSRRLHFGQTSVLVVIKSYSAKSSGYIRGVASVSPCMGVVHTNVRRHQIYSMPNKGYIEFTPLDYPGHNLVVAHRSGCFVAQYLGGDNYKIKYSYHVRSLLTFHITTDFKRISPHHAIGSSVKRLFRLFDRETVVYSEGFRHCRLSSDEFRILYAYDDVNQTVWLRKTPPRDGYTLEYICPSFVLSVAVVISDGKANSRQCQLPIEIESHYLKSKLDTTSFIHFPVPALPCGSVQIRGKRETFFLDDKFMQEHHVLSFIRPYTDTPCCILKLRVLAANEFYQSIKQYFLDRHWPKPHSSWSFLWLRSGWNGLRNVHAFKFDKSSSVINLLGREWRTNSLFGEVGFSFFISKMISSFSHQKSLMNISFNFTLLDSNQYGFSQAELNDPADDRNNYFCSKNIGSCYLFLPQRMASWESAKEICILQGMDLLTSPSDFEWKFIADIFARQLSNRPRYTFTEEEPVVVAFLNLHYVTVKYII